MSQEVKFVITDFKNEINVVYSGAVPNLFQEGKGVVAEGYLKDRNFFLATNKEYSFLSSSTVKEIAQFGGCISHLVPINVAKDLQLYYGYNC